MISYETQIPHIPVIAIAVIVIVAMILLVAAIFVRNYVKVPPNKVAVFTGRGKQKIVRGGARFRVPGIERVDEMSLEPFDVEAKAENVYSVNGVPVNVTAKGLIRFGSTDEMIATAVERFLTTPRETLQGQVQEILAGSMRSIVSQMTVEELNGSRDQLKAKIIEEAESAFAPIGMQLDVLTIQKIDDVNGYLNALGSKRIAEVKRDAAVGEADAERATRVNKAAADQASAEAEAVAATAVAEANQRRDLRIAQLQAETDAEQARADQAGPLAQAEARAAVGVAEANADQQREQAQIDVERQRALRATEAQRASVIVPAEAARQAAVLEAEGQRDAAIAKATADAETRRLSGQADAEARQLQAVATQAEMEARAQGELATLKAQAEGQKELADAQNAFTESAQRLQVLPQLIDTVPQIVKAIAEGVQIEHMVVMDHGGSDGQGNAFSRASSTVPIALFQANETLKALGIDLEGLLGGVLKVNGNPPQSPSKELAQTNGSSAGTDGMSVQK